jgi:hypothetical protein
MDDSERTPNRLAHETSPYLLQHAWNPVDWHPWGPEALAKARELDRPIFLSVGYSACHWCHVMERESFEDEAVAARLNALFVCIKVDREERPDLDDIYMKAVQALTGSGGWPMTVFLTPQLKPFFGGTYFPPRRAHGRPSFTDVILHVDTLWKRQREQVLAQGERLAGYIAGEGLQALEGDLDPSVLERSREALEGNFDPTWGGFGSAPKFPHAVDLRLCLRHWRRSQNPMPRDLALLTLERMAEGGIYDHLGGGFARYSTDERWLIPHFEKMLYDNALLIPAYLDAYLITREERHARVVRECCGWVRREMTTPEGGFASAQDADSEGEEGKFYVWTPGELEAVLGERRGRLAARWFGVTAEGNFEHGTSALWRHEPAEVLARELGTTPAELEAAMEAARPELLAARARRIPPLTDDKVLVAWNGLMISALAQAWQVLGDDRDLAAARRAARYVQSGMRQADGRLFATARAGRAHLNAYLDDYAFLIQGLIDLYESDFDEGWLAFALELDEILRERFFDAERGGYFTTASDHETLIARLKSPQDGALPSGNAVQVLNLLRLAELTGRRALAEEAERALRSVGELLNRYPQAFSQMLLAVDFLAAGPREIVLAGDPAEPAFQELARELRRTFLPQRVVARARPGADEALLPLVAGKSAPAGEARAFVCRNYTCGLPAKSAAELRAELERGR